MHGVACVVFIARHEKGMTVDIACPRCYCLMSTRMVRPWLAIASASDDIMMITMKIEYKRNNLNGLENMRNIIRFML